MNEWINTTLKKEPEQPETQAQETQETNDISKYDENVVKAINYACTKKTLKKTISSILDIKGNTKDVKTMIVEIIQEGDNAYLRQLAKMPTQQILNMIESCA